MLVDASALKGPFGWSNYEPEVGHVIERWHPFTLYLDRYETGWDESFVPIKWSDSKRWRPGSWDTASIGYDQDLAYHSKGRCRIEVHAIAHPKGFPRRIMYTRQFTTPDGKEYKRSGLICHSIGKFRNVCRSPGVGGVMLKDFEPIVQELAL